MAKLTLDNPGAQAPGQAPARRPPSRSRDPGPRLRTRRSGPRARAASGPSSSRPSHLTAPLELVVGSLGVEHDEREGVFERELAHLPSPPATRPHLDHRRQQGGTPPLLLRARARARKWWALGANAGVPPGPTSINVVRGGDTVTRSPRLRVRARARARKWWALWATRAQPARHEGAELEVVLEHDDVRINHEPCQYRRSPLGGAGEAPP